MELTSATSGIAVAKIDAADKAAATIGSDFETFLKMMTTQLQNQDPMNPIEGSDYAVQLATFSGVEQQTKTNQLLEGLSGQFGMFGMAQMAGWVGAEARAAMPLQIDGGAAVALSPNPAAEADRVVMVVTNAAGDVVNRVDLAPGSTTLDWVPVDIAGNPLPTGQYRFELENHAGDRQLQNSAVEAYATIVEVRGGVSGMTLVMEGGIEVPAAAVTALRE